MTYRASATDHPFSSQRRAATARIASTAITAVALCVGLTLPALSQQATTVDTLAQLDGGTGGITVDAAGNVFSSDFGAVLTDASTAGTKIFKITPAGEVSVYAEGIKGASGSGMDAQGNFYQSNLRGGSITKIANDDGASTTFASDGFELPVGIEVDPDGTLYVANCGSHSIQRVTPDGTSTRFVDSELLNCANGITRANDGNLYVANFSDGNVIKITPKGEASVFATLPGGGNGHLIFAYDTLWVIARLAHQVYRVDLDGTVTLIAGSGEKGGTDGAAGEASFCYPNDLGWSPDGSILYVNDVADHASTGNLLAPTRVRRIRFEQEQEK